MATLRKATVIFVTSLCLSVLPSAVHVERCFHWTDLHEIWYLKKFRKNVEKIQAELKYDKNNWYFTWRNTYICDSISLNSCKNEKRFKQICIEYQNTILCLLTFFSRKSCRLCDNEKNYGTARQAAHVSAMRIFLLLGATSPNGLGSPHSRRF
jgi:hypothetical protein